MTAFVEAGTAGHMVLPDGTSAPLTTATLRFTEFTVGTDGPARMPATLPATSAYTMAFEASVDEALAAGATSVTWDTPITVLLDNFLEIPVGISVPVGLYDRTRGVWDTETDGQVVEVLGETGGVALLDVDGDGVAETDAFLDGLGLTVEERAALLDRFAIGDSFWHLELRHFSPCDPNFSPRFPPDACYPLACTSEDSSFDPSGEDN